MRTLIAIALIASYSLHSQDITSVAISFTPVFDGKPLMLNHKEMLPNGIEVDVSNFKFYVSNVEFISRDQVIYSESSSYHLIDISDIKSTKFQKLISSNLEYDHIRFNLGIDSITNSGGVLGGDLDPIKAMYWTWQSGYINFKIEGYASSSAAKNHEFEFHIGGYIPPFYALQKIDLPLRNRNNIDIQLDFTKVFNAIDFSKTNHIMLPCIQAVDLAKILAHSFSINSL